MQMIRNFSLELPFASVRLGQEHRQIAPARRSATLLRGGVLRVKTRPESLASAGN
jgi:hypothetical protein